tara:strand:- start:329 stop:496 length:168 start_codon:yes stop_codon:yes gene_type:complete
LKESRTKLLFKIKETSSKENTETDIISEGVSDEEESPIGPILEKASMLEATRSLS